MQRNEVTALLNTMYDAAEQLRGMHCRDTYDRKAVNRAMDALKNAVEEMGNLVRSHSQFG